MNLGARAGQFQRLAVEIGAVQGGNCRFCLGIVPHLDKAEASRQASPPVSHDLEALNSPVLFKNGSNVLSSYGRAEVAYKNIVHDWLLRPFWQKTSGADGVVSRD